MSFSANVLHYGCQIIFVKLSKKQTTEAKTAFEFMVGQEARET